MFSNVTNYVQERINSTPLEKYPYVWFETNNIFPEEFYNLMLKNSIPIEYLATLNELGRVAKSYSKERSVLVLKPDLKELPIHIRTFWENFAIWLQYTFKKIILNKFNIKLDNLIVDNLYIRDHKNYVLSPHTDSPKKILTGLFYTPSNSQHSHLGTSLYVPVDPTFKCNGGPHHPYNWFNLYKTIPYIPNNFFCFLKSDVSFHGVEPVDIDVDRDLIITNIQKC